MLEVLSLVLALALLVAPLVLAIVALVRSARVGELERRIARLERQLRERGAPAEEREPVAGTRAAPAELPAATSDLGPLASPARPPVPALEPRRTVEPPAAREPAPPEPAVPSVPSGPGGPAPPRVDRIDWERWLGVRGAAVAGGVVLALAGVLLVKQAVDAGWIRFTPPVRVLSALALGVAAIAGGEALRPRRYRHVPDALVGAGIVALYGASWAAHRLYDLVPLPVAFGGMVAVTVLCVALATRHRAQLVALLGLVGGFATPLLLATGESRPIGLFGYVLLLDLGLLAVGRRRGWPSLAAAAVGGTTAIQLLWTLGSAEPGDGVVGLVALAVLGLAFALGTHGAARGRNAWGLAQIAGLAAPIPLAVLLSVRVDLGPHLYPLGLVLLVLAAASVWLGERQGSRELPLVLAAGSALLVLAWTLRAELSDALAWELVGVAVALAATFHAPMLAGLGRPARPAAAGAPDAGDVAATGMLLAWCFGARDAASLGPWAAGVLALGALVLASAARGARPWVQAASAVLAAWTLAAHGSSHVLPVPGGGPVALALLVTVLAALLAVLARRAGERRAGARAAAALFPLAFLATAAWQRWLDASPPEVELGLPLVLAALASLSARRGGSAAWLAAAALVLVVLQEGPLRELWLETAPSTSRVLRTLAPCLVAAAWLTLFPFVGRGAPRSRLAEVVAAAAAPAWLVLASEPIGDRWGVRAAALVPLALAPVVLAAAQRVRRLPRAEEGERSRFARARAWTGASAALLLALALARGVGHHVPVAWASLGTLALALLWRRWDHPWLQLGAGALGTLATVSLLVKAATPGSYAHQEVPVVNWILYAHGLAAASLLAAARIHEALEERRARAFPWPAAARPRRPVAALLATGGVVALFLWVNLAVLDLFATGERVRFPLERLQARDLSLSLAWALFALGLLAAGVARRSPAPRWASLVLLLATLGKVFLRDVGELEGLYRVASLAGLALSLLAVSLAYQRFVFERRPQPRPAESPPGNG